MKYVIIVELALTLLVFGIAVYSSVTNQSNDSGPLIALYYLAGAAMAGITILTCLGWWGWTVVHG